MDGHLRSRPRSGPGRAGGRGVCGRGPVDGRLDGGRILPEQPGSRPRGSYDRHHGRLRPASDRSRLPRGPRKCGRDPVPVARGPGTSSGTRSEGVQGQPPLAGPHEVVVRLSRPPDAALDAGLPLTTATRLRLPENVLFVYGEEDLVCPREAVEATAAELPESVVRCMARSGHSVYFERAGAFNREVADFLSARYR